MRYIFIEITEAHADALDGKLEFKLSEPEPCQVRCMVKPGPSDPVANPIHELLRLSYEKLIRIYNLKPFKPSDASRYANHKAKTKELLAALGELK